jgi:uncharacterized protein
LSVSATTIAIVMAPDPQYDLTDDEARRIQLRAQGLLGSTWRRRGVPAMLRMLGAVQLDTISVLARSHELVAYARLGAVGRRPIETAYWGTGNGDPARTFEYWSHAACVLPAEEWPHFAFRRRARRKRGRRWHQTSPEACERVLARLRADGPLTATELGGAKRGGPWWDWSDTKIAVEWLLDIGEVVCARRTGWRRVYDLPERALPTGVVTDELDDRTCLTRLVRDAGRALGVATRADLADYHRLTTEQVDQVVADAGLVPVTVARWATRGGTGRDGAGGGRAGRGGASARAGAALAWADPEALSAPARGHHRTTLLSPFDSLIWDRKRAKRVFGFDHRLEAYVPRAKRVHGYFAMPLLAGGRLVGRVDPAREGSTLVARRVSLERPGTVESMATALREAAEWVGCDSVRVEISDPAPLAAELRAALA